MERKVRILVVEDETAIREGLCDLLVFHGYSPASVESGEEAVRRGNSGAFSLVLLDLMLPDKNGFDVCHELRAHSPGLPILMLTALGADEDVVRGLRSGADDYLRKPFSSRELLARIEALLRRSGVLPERARFDFGPWQIDVEGMVALQGEKRVGLNRREVELLTVFARERGRVLSRERLLAEVWRMPFPESAETRTVDVHISKLRRKIDSEDRSLIETVRGAGYRYPP